MKQKFRKGDILYNTATSKDNPFSHQLYLGMSKCQGQKCYKTMHFNGTIGNYFVDDKFPMEYVGHLNEYDEFISAIKHLGLKGGAE